MVTRLKERGTDGNRSPDVWFVTIPIVARSAKQHSTTIWHCTLRSMAVSFRADDDSSSS